MRRNLRKFQLCLVLALVNCGDKSPTSKSSTSSTPTQATTDGGVTFDIHKTWNVVEKRCGGKTIAAKPGEAYRFDQSTYVQMGQVADDDTHTCVAGDVYTIVTVSTTTSNNGFEQDGLLNPIGRKQTCRAKKDGVVTDDVVTTQEDTPQNEAPTELVLSASFGRSDAHLSLSGHPDCPNGKLELVLKP